MLSLGRGQADFGRLSIENRLRQIPQQLFLSCSVKLRRILLLYHKLQNDGGLPLELEGMQHEY